MNNAATGTMTLSNKGKEYRGEILNQMVRVFGQDTTVAILEHDGLLGLVNAAAHQASEAPTAQQAAAYPVFLIKRISEVI